MLIDMRVDDAFVDSLIRPECLFRPGSFSGLMTIYESNYIRLRQLLPDVEALTGARISCTSRDCDLHVCVLDQQAYTTTLKLTYEFPDADGAVVLDPDLTIRVYHDARLAEAMAVCAEHRHEKLKELARTHSRRELGRRWQSNMMLNKWLDYLQDMGHSLTAR
jgi:uncharacterized protein YqiB (DUF1249 family)